MTEPKTAREDISAQDILDWIGERDGAFILNKNALRQALDRERALRELLAEYMAAEDAFAATRSEDAATTLGRVRGRVQQTLARVPTPPASASPEFAKAYVVARPGPKTATVYLRFGRHGDPLWGAPERARVFGPEEAAAQVAAFGGMGAFRVCVPR